MNLNNVCEDCGGNNFKIENMKWKRCNICNLVSCFSKENKDFLMKTWKDISRKRNTGRTHNMLVHAHLLAEEGRAVYIIAHDQHQARRFEKEIKDSSIKVEVLKSTNNWSELNFDWETLTLRGAHPNCVVLLDHHVIEKRFWRLLEMWSRYDNKALIRDHTTFETSY